MLYRRRRFFLKFLRFWSKMVVFGPQKYIFQKIRPCETTYLFSSMSTQSKQEHRSCRLQALLRSFHAVLYSTEEEFLKYLRFCSKIVDFGSQKVYFQKNSLRYTTYFFFPYEHVQKVGTSQLFFASIKKKLSCCTEEDEVL